MPSKKLRTFILLITTSLLIPYAHHAEEAKRLWKAAMKLKTVTFEKNKVVIQTEGPASPAYRVFDVGEPARIVLELRDTWIPPELESERFAQNGESFNPVAKIRLAQFSSEPEAIVRVVLDLKEKTPYKVTQLNGTINVEFTGMEKTAATSLTLKQPAPIQLTPTHKPKDVLKELPTELVSLNLRDVDIQAALNMLIAKLEAFLGEKINLIMGRDVTGTLTIQLEDVPFNEAWGTILSMKGLVATQTGTNILKITGKTTYMAERQQAVTFTKIFILNYAKAEDMKINLDAIRDLDGRKGSIIVNKDINALIVTDTEEGLNQVARLIRDLDIKPTTVAIEAKLVDLRLDKSMDYGVQWEYARTWDRSTPSEVDRIDLGRTNPNTATPVGGLTATPPVGVGVGIRGTGVNLAQSLLPISAGISFGRVTNTSFLTATLSMAESKGNLKVLSNPKIVTLNNQTANIQVGSEIPILQTTLSQGIGATQSVAYKQIGISLTVTPTVNPDRYIRMYIKPTVSQLGTRGGITGVAPGIDNRSAETYIITKDQETIVIGGLISERTDKQTTKVPILGDIPLLGILFRRTSNENVRNELLVFVTPKILD